MFTGRFRELVDSFERGRGGKRLNCRGFIFPPIFRFFRGRGVPPVDFHYAHFGPGACFERAAFTAGPRFDWAVFGEGARFDEASFGDGVSFGGAEFGGAPSFDRARFGARASFGGGKLGGKAGFFGARFGDGASFGGVDFGGDATFLGAKFGESASFEGARFGDKALFVETSFGHGARFDNCAFGNGSGFWKAEFRGSASFAGAAAEGSLHFSGDPVSGKPVSGKPASRLFGANGNSAINFEQMILAQPERVAFESVNLQRASFIGTDLSLVGFEDAAWPMNRWGNRLFPGRIERGEFEPPRGAEAFSRLEALSHQLGSNYARRGNHAEVARFRWAEMEYRRRRWLASGGATGGASATGGALGRLRGRLLGRIYGLYRALSGYGVGAGSALRALLVALAAAVFLQGLLGIHQMGQGGLERDFPCARTGGPRFRRLGLLEGEAGACPNANISSARLFLHAGYFTLQSASFQSVNRYEAATAAGQGIAIFVRIFTPLQLLLLLGTLRRRFGLFAAKKPKKT